MANMPTARVVLVAGETLGLGAGVSGKSQRDAVLCSARPWGQHKGLYVAAITRQQRLLSTIFSSR